MYFPDPDIHKAVKAISFKNPELMVQQWQYQDDISDVWRDIEDGSNIRGNDTRIIFIRKEHLTCHTPHQELFNYMSKEHNVTLLVGDIHEIINIVGRIKEQGEDPEGFYTELMKLINRHVKNGLSKPDLVKSMKYAIESCEKS